MIFTIILIVVVILNLAAILAMILKERKKPEVIISWLLLFSFLPILGFVIYVLIGGGLSIKNRNMLRRKQYYNEHAIDYYRDLVNNQDAIKNPEVKKLINFNIKNAQSAPTFNNKVQIFTSGHEKINSLIKDIQSATSSVNIEYYIFGNDEIGQRVMEALVQKAKQGVVVNLIYDSVGSLKTPRRFFAQLKKAGGRVREFFPPLFHIRLINLKMNYRNHRKIAVIDGKVGYVGGMNIRGDHCGLNPRLCPWGDTHLRIEGQAVYALQNEFLNFFRFCNKHNQDASTLGQVEYFPAVNTQGKTIIQTLASGPDSNNHDIKENMQKMLCLAQKEVVLQTPYFVPDAIFLSAIRTAINSGVRFKLIIPGKPDKKFVYNATLSFAHELVDMGGEVYIFDGFMHAKALVVDDFAMTIGTSNADNRSFDLNFEINTVLYDKKLVAGYKKHIKGVIEECRKVDKNFFKNKPWFAKFKQLFFRLFSPLF